MNNYTDLEIENWVCKLLSASETIGPWGYETDPPNDNDIKSAKMLKQLLDDLTSIILKFRYDKT